MARKRLGGTDPKAEFENSMRNDRVLKTLFKVAMDQENRLRAIEGRAALTAADARARLKALFTG